MEAMDQEAYKQAFEKSQNKGDLQLTKEEAEKFKTAFEDPEFCKLMSEYVADLQNPEYRAETEAYISQLESEEKVPQGKELIRPRKGFVAKTHKRDAKGAEETKLFINIVQSEKISKPTKTDTAKGQNWSLPYSLGPPHMEKDKKSDAVVAFDCCFHPDALVMGERHKAFKELLVSTAIQGIEESFKLQKQATKVNTNFHILKGITYKSGDIPTMMVDISTKEDKWKKETSNDSKLGNSNNDSNKKISTSKAEEKDAVEMATAVEEASTQKKPAKPANKSQRPPAMKKGFLNNAKTAGSIYPEGSSEGSRKPPPSPLIQELPEGHTRPAPSKSAQQKTDQSSALLREREVRPRHAVQSTESPKNPSSSKSPQFSVTERGVLGLGDFDGGVSSLSRRPKSSRPEELVCKIEIPKVTKTSLVELDVGQRQVKMSYLDIYELCIQLPYSVFEKRGTAKFDKAKKLLTITLPVQPASPQEEEDQEEAEVVERLVEVSESAAVKSHKQRSGSTNKTEAHKRWLSGESSAPDDTAEEATRDSKKTESLSDEIKRKAKEALASAEAEKSRPQVEKSKSPSKPLNAPVSSDFIPSGSYVGSKAGFVFKKGSEGVGYYADDGGIGRRKDALLSDPHDTTEGEDVVAASLSLQHSTPQPFEYQYRQTPQGIAVIVDVKGIVEKSVNITFGAKRVDVQFAALESSVDSSPVSYGLTLECLKELSPEACHYDVATQNMVLVLQKKVEEYWLAETFADGSKSEVLSSRKLDAGISEEPTSTASTTDSNQLEEQLKKTSALLEEMNFGSTGLMELD